MKKVKNFLKSNLKFVMGIMLGSITFGTMVYATTILFASNQVDYDNTNSGMTAVNVQEAIDELCTKADGCKNTKNNIVYFAYGEPTTSSTTNYTTLNKNIFVAKNGDQKSVCIIRNNRLHCFDSNNYAIEKEHLLQVFSDGICDETYLDTFCVLLNSFSCSTYIDGTVTCIHALSDHTSYGCSVNDVAMCDDNIST